MRQLEKLVTAPAAGEALRSEEDERDLGQSSLVNLLSNIADIRSLSRSGVLSHLALSLLV